MNRYEKMGLVFILTSLEVLSMAHRTIIVDNGGDLDGAFWGLFFFAMGGSIMLFLWGDKE